MYHFYLGNNINDRKICIELPFVFLKCYSINRKVVIYRVYYCFCIEKMSLKCLTSSSGIKYLSVINCKERLIFNLLSQKERHIRWGGGLL